VAGHQFDTRALTPETKVWKVLKNAVATEPLMDL